ncbi:uncharacterized protein [Bombus fervidus]|uniref:uncharacterized protein n=1 Tax=Bombus fervidus TaxID=203811 RepID=UPI003D18D514
MYAIQNTVSKVPRLLNICQNQRRTILATPPRVRIPFPEKVLLGMAIWIGVMGVPLYIACNVNKYNTQKKG